MPSILPKEKEVGTPKNEQKSKNVKNAFCVVCLQIGREMIIFSCFFPIFLLRVTPPPPPPKKNGGGGWGPPAPPPPDAKAWSTGV